MLRGYCKDTEGERGGIRNSQIEIIYSVNNSSEVLFKLLRIALGKECDYSLPLSVNWKEVIDLSFEQGVAAIVVDGLQKIYDFVESSRVQEVQGFKALEDLDSPKLEDLKYEWFGEVMNQEQDYERHTELIARLSSKLSENGIRMMLLKGVGCSLNYPVPSHRSVGDIDIYCFDKGVEANRVFESQGIAVEENLGHHSRLSIDGISIENHHLLMDEDTYHSNRSFEAEVQGLIKSDVEEVEIGGAKVLVPGPTLMALHLLRHSSGDFASNTINLRQMLDYALLVNKRSGEIDWAEVTRVVDTLGMRGYFGALNDLSVNVFGVERDKFPAFKEDAALRERILNDTLYAPKCHDFPDYHHKLIYGLAKTRQAWNNRWKNKLVFNESFLSLYWQKAWNRLNPRFK